MKTSKTIEEIEVALAKTAKFNYVRNLVVFNVYGYSARLLIDHECDMLIMSKSGYLTEVEIKRSWTDFLADFKKRHRHDNAGIIKFFYYCVPLAVKESCEEVIEKEGLKCSGVITYDENLYIRFPEPFCEITPNQKLTAEQQFELARLGTMRVVTLKNRLAKNEKKNSTESLGAVV